MVPEPAAEDAFAGGRDEHRPPVQPHRAAGELLLLDVRRFTPSLVRSLVNAVVDELIALDAQDDLYVVSDYEPSGLAYQLDLRHETRGLFHSECRQRSDGAWVLIVTRV